MLIGLVLAAACGSDDPPTQSLGPARTGSLVVAINGLPLTTSASVTVTGPGGYVRQVGGTQTLSGLTLGDYLISASGVTAQGGSYTPSPSSQTQSVTAGSAATATVTYTLSAPATLNLRLDGAYLTQAAQRYDGTGPLVAGRDAYLRAFAVANEANTVMASVRVRLFHGAALVQTWTLPAPFAGVPTAPDESSLLSSWNIRVPGALVQPGLNMLVDVDPDDAIPETDDSDNGYPASGIPQILDVRALPTLSVRFVPVLQQVNGLQGNVTSGNAPAFLEETTRMLPVAAWQADVRDVYTTSAPALESNNANNAWNTILSEVLALKTADGSTRYYYGVVRVSYSSGVAGIGYVGGTARTALGWDRLPSGSSVMAHELGHNMGRRHAPCGGAPSPDSSYPYEGGSIGIWGVDVAVLALMSPGTFRDLMGYCSAEWVSDYTWDGAVAYRAGGPNNTAEGATALAGPGLLVWGRLTSDGPVLEPAFLIDAPAVPPPGGPHLVQGLDDAGRPLFAVRFAAEEMADHSLDPEQAFAFVVPAAVAALDRLTELRLTAEGRTANRRTALVRRVSGGRAAREAPGLADVRWDAAAFPMAMIRDAGTGQILAFARNGRVVFPEASGRYLVTFSDGVRSSRETLALP